MKRMFVLALALFAFSAIAEDLKYADLNYFYKTGQVNLSANLMNAGRTNSYGPTRRFVRGWENTLGGTIGFSDQINLFAQVGYNWDVEVADDGVKREFNQDGVTNPVLGGLYRVFDQSNSALNFDIGAFLHFNFQDEQRGAIVNSREKEGNAANGRNALDLYARIGKKWNEANEWQLIGGLTRNFAGDHKEYSGTTNIEWDDDSSVDIFARAYYQYRPVNEFMLLLALQGTRVGSRSSSATSNDLEDDSHLDVDLTFTAKYLILENFMFRFMLAEAVRYSDYDRDVNGTTLDVHRRKYVAYGFGFDYLF